MQGFFDHLEHDGLLKMLAWRIADRACLGLMRKGLKAGRLETDGRVIHPDPGVPPGGVVSPVVANV
jgi:retron-type reverse transcriptase